MTPEDLMKPRYKVIADYPKNKFGDVGRIINLVKRSDRFRYEWYEHDGIDYEYESFFEEYPHIFKKLEWWEERKQNDFPEYVKPLEPTDGFIKQFGDVILKVRLNTIGIWDNGRASFFAENLFQAARLDFADYLPATELEYSQYQASKPKQP